MFTPIIAGLMLLCAGLTLLTLFFDRTLFYISASVTCLVFAVVLVLLRRMSKNIRRLLGEIERGIRLTADGNFADFPIPVLTVYEGSEIVWCNELCVRDVFDGRDVRGEDISELFPQLLGNGGKEISCQNLAYGDRLYTAYLTDSPRRGENISVLYLFEDTQLKRLANEYYETRPSVAILMVDNYEEMVQDSKEIERAQVMSEIESMVEQYVMEHSGFVVRVTRDKFLAVVEERGIAAMVADRFHLLDAVRSMHTSGRMAPTLSIGVGHGAQSLYEADGMARQALDMCLGRGGDQAAVKTQSGYEFFGGVSKGIEKRTKVKTRIIATALAELIESADNVVIMGHRFADLDCVGAAVGMLRSARAMGKPSCICLNKEKNLVEPLLQKLYAGGYGDYDFVDPELVLRDWITERTLLIILDTHVPHVLESEAVYRACREVVVIDHHRRLVGHIDNAVIFYHEPYASSASEMIAELTQYFPVPPQIARLEAEAMMAGIMLDTKNFVLRTGVRTFEAAAYLRRQGADTVEVRKLFASSMDAYQHKTALVSNAEIYRGCAIAASDYQFEGINLVAPQAADELMTIDGVDASFVVFLTGSQVNVSARSMGAVNVQLVMEQLGGGGHHTMAAAQFPEENIENVRKKLMEAIDDYFLSLADPPAS